MLACHIDEDPGIPEELSAQYRWIVTKYYYASWEGSGDAVGMHNDGMIHVWNIGHCSCYGPFQTFHGGASEPNVMTVEQYLAPRESVHDLSIDDALDAKVRELIAEQAAAAN